MKSKDGDNNRELISALAGVRLEFNVRARDLSSVLSSFFEVYLKFSKIEFNYILLFARILPTMPYFFSFFLTIFFEIIFAIKKTNI